MSYQKLRKLVLHRDQCCQYKSKDGRTCGSRWDLEADHIIPRWAGGKDTLDNLNHNRYRYQQQSGIRKI